MQSIFWIAKVVPCTKKDVVDLLWMKLNNAELAMFVASIKVDYFFSTAKNIPIFCKKLPPRFQLEKHHRSQQMGYWNSIWEETITEVHQHALQMEHI